VLLCAVVSEVDCRHGLPNFVNNTESVSMGK